MSRFDNDEGDWNEGRCALWQNSIQRALKGRKGLAVLREVETALLALSQKRLIEGSIARDGEVCVVGAWARMQFERRRVLRFSRYTKQEFHTLDELAEEFWDDGCDAESTAEFGHVNGMGLCVAWALSEQNDEGPARDDAERYAHVLAWVRRKIAENPHQKAEANNV